MQLPDNKLQKHKRILLMSAELERYKIDFDAAIDFLSYVFSISPNYVCVVLKNNTLTDMESVHLEHVDLDTKLVDLYVQKVSRQAKVARNQLSLNLEK